MFRKAASAAMAGFLVLGSLIGATSVAFGVTPGAPWDPFFASPAVVADIAAVAPVSTSSNRDFGVAAGDFDADGKVDAVVGRTDGRVVFLKGNGDATFAAPTLFGWKLETFNAWAFAAGDINGDGKLDVLFGANAAGADAGAITRVNDGDLRYLLGNGDGTFDTTGNYVRSSITFNAGSLIADVGTDTGSVAVGDVNGDGRLDIAAGTIDGANTTVKVLLGTGAGAFGTAASVISQATTCTAPCSPIYYPAISTQNSPWGLAIADADGDGDADLWVTDRALYTYLYRNGGSGVFTRQDGNAAVSGRPNVYLGHDTVRAAVGFTASTASGDVNGDGRADLFLGLHAGLNTPTTGCGSPSGPCVHDGEIVLDVSAGSGHTGFGSLADIGTEARGVTLVDINGDAALDIVTGNYEGQVVVLRQLPPIDSDADGVSDYVDNAPAVANAARLDMNVDGSVNQRDQLDNDFDTVLGNPEVPATWVRLGDPADPDDDNDGVADGADNCPFVANAGQANADGDAFGDACDPLDGRDPDADGAPTGPLAGDPLYAQSQAAAAKWSTGTTHFVIRIDALGRFFQNEFTQLMTDAATLSPAEWAAKCGENYQPEVDSGDPADPCGSPVTLPGGKEVPVSLVTIPKQLWTDPPVVAWVNDRNASPRFDLGQHMTYHTNNTPVSDWMALSDRNFYSCEMCGLSEAEVFELGKIGNDTLLGNYTNKWVAESGATASSPKIDWTDAAYPLLSFAPPFNTSDPVAREAVAQLGFKAFSASWYEEAGSYGPIFTPEGSHHEQFDQFGMFHASADLQLNPPATSSGSYNATTFENYLEASTDAGGLTTWLVEEVDWSGRPCNDDDRLGTCGGGSNRENNTVYSARWNAWIQLLDFVKNYPGGVAMTMAEVALAKGYDNAPTVPNAGQADADHDGIGDVIDGAALDLANASLARNVEGALTASLTNGAGAPIAGQDVVFGFDADGDGTPETFTAATNASGIATAHVTPARPVGTGLVVSAAWDGVRATATDTATADVTDTSTLTLDAANPTSGLIGDTVNVSARLTDSDPKPLEGRAVSFSIGSDTASATTLADGTAMASITLSGPNGSRTLEASWLGDAGHAADSDTATFVVLKRGTNLLFAADTPTSGDLTDSVTVEATLTDTATGTLAGQSVTFTLGAQTAAGTTDGSGLARATFAVTGPLGVQTLAASFAGNGTYGAASDSRSFTVNKETVTLTMPNAVATKKGGSAKTTATLRDSDDGGLAGKVIRFYAVSRGQYKLYNTVTTDANGVAVWFVPASLVGTPTSPTPIRAVFDGDGTYASVTTNASAYRQ